MAKQAKKGSGSGDGRFWVQYPNGVTRELYSQEAVDAELNSYGGDQINTPTEFINPEDIVEADDEVPEEAPAT